MASEAQRRASHKWTKENRDRIGLFVPKGLKEQIVERAKSTTGSMNSYLLKLIYDDLGIDEIK